MMNIYLMNSGNMAAMMAEDAGAAELRSPLNSGMKSRGLIARLLERMRRRSA